MGMKGRWDWDQEGKTWVDKKNGERTARNADHLKLVKSMLIQLSCRLGRPNMSVYLPVYVLPHHGSGKGHEQTGRSGNGKGT